MNISKQQSDYFYIMILIVCCNKRSLVYHTLPMLFLRHVYCYVFLQLFTSPFLDDIMPCVFVCCTESTKPHTVLQFCKQFLPNTIYCNFFQTPFAAIFSKHNLLQFLDFLPNTIYCIFWKIEVIYNMHHTNALAVHHNCGGVCNAPVLLCTLTAVHCNCSAL